MKKSKIFILTGALLLTSLFVIPIWNITLEAPQYPDPIGMDIFINKFKSAEGNDIQNINIMNHYVGMKKIPESIPEFSIFPYCIVALIVLGIVFALVGKRQLYVAWLVLMMAFGTVAMYDFYQWEYDYGHDLSADAPIKFTDENGDPLTYQPPLIGSKTILNFKATSTPLVGTYVMIASIGLVVLAFVTAKKETHEKATKNTLSAAV